MQLHLNTEIKIAREMPEMKIANDTSFTFRLAQVALAPYRYLFDGKTIVIDQVQAQKEVIHVHPNFPEKSMFKTALAVMALVPGLIVGVLLRFASILLGGDRESIALVEQFYQRKIELPQAPEGATLAQYRQEIAPFNDEVMGRIGEDPAIWQDPQFVRDFTTALENAYRFTEVYFRQLGQECENNPRQMVDRMIFQPQQGLGDRQDFCHTFFYFPTLYQRARGHAALISSTLREQYGIGEEERMPLKANPRLTEEQQRPFFDPRTPQYRWRMMQNAFCDKLDQLNLRPLLEADRGGDGRFSNWARHDRKMVTNYSIPDTTPT